MLNKLPTWFRIMSAILALPFVALTPLALLFFLGTVTHSGPGGHATYPYTFAEIAYAAAIVLFTLFYGLFFIWLALGAPASLRKAEPRVDDFQESYRGPRCVACREPIAPEAKTCSKCGWTQPNDKA